jgi:hypothetical protein
MIAALQKSGRAVKDRRIPDERRSARMPRNVTPSGHAREDKTR